MPARLAPQVPCPTISGPYISDGSDLAALRDIVYTSIERRTHDTLRRLVEQGGRVLLRVRTSAELRERAPWTALWQSGSVLFLTRGVVPSATIASFAYAVYLAWLAARRRAQNRATMKGRMQLMVSELAVGLCVADAGGESVSQPAAPRVPGRLADWHRPRARAPARTVAAQSAWHTPPWRCSSSAPPSRTCCPPSTSAPRCPASSSPPF